MDGPAPRVGREALVEWGVEYHEFVVEGTSEDVAMLLAWDSGAQLIVAVGVSTARTWPYCLLRCCSSIIADEAIRRSGAGQSPKVDAPPRRRLTRPAA